METKIIQKVNNRLTRKFQWYACEDLYLIERYHSFSGCYVGKLDALQKLSRIEHAVLLSSYE